jgi:flagellar basal-body rod modification protein FlgD
MTTGNVGSTGTTAKTSSSTSSSSNLNLNANDFVNMMITQLQHQDPMNPSNTDQLMSQMSAIGQMQTSSQLQTTLSSLASQTQIGAASSLMGKQVSGIDSSNNTVAGIVTSVQVAGSTVNLALDSGATLALGNVASITPAATATTGA